MGFFSAVSGLCSSVISSVMSSIGPAVATFAAKIAGAVGSILTNCSGLFGTILNIANSVFQAIGIFKPNEKPDDMGERALQAAEAGVKLEEFDDFDEYLEKLRNFELDPDKASQRSPVEKLVAGMAVGTAGLEKKFGYQAGSLGEMWMLSLSNPQYFNADRLVPVITSGQPIGNIMNYLSNKISAGESFGFEESLSKIDGMGSKSDLYKALDESKAQWAHLQAQVEGINKN